MNSEDTTKNIDEALYYMHNDTEKAIKIFDEILEKDPENVDALNGKGSSLMKLNRMREAESHFDYSLSIKKTASALISKGTICKGRKHFKQSLCFYDEAIEINPDLKSIVTILKNEIRELIGSDIEINVNYTSETNELIKKGLSLKNNNRLWDALDCYEKAIEIDVACKNSVKALINDIKSILKRELMIKTPELGDSRIDQLKLQCLRLFLIEENHEQALTIMNLILDDNENEIDTLNQKGCLLFLFDEFEPAIDCFNKCLSLDEKYTYALFNKAMALRRIKKLDEALDCFDELLKMPQNYDKVKPYQLEILDKLHEKDIS